MVFGLGSGVGSAPPLKPTRYGCRPFLVRTMPIWVVKAMSSLDSLLSKLGFSDGPEVLVESGPDEVLGLAGIIGFVTVMGTATRAAADEAVVSFGGGGRGRGRSR